jgi:Protein of unknown function (DUF3467)
VNDTHEEPTLEITIEPEHQAGVWANFAQVVRSEHEFTIDLVRIDHATGPQYQGTVVARVAMSPLFVTQLIEMLDLSWKEYAKRALPKEIFDDEAEQDNGENG